MEIRIVNYSRGPLEINKDLWNGTVEGEFAISVRAQLRYADGSGAVGFQIDMSLAKSADGTPVMNLGLLLGLHVNGAVDFQKDGSAVAEICRYVWPMVIGAVAASTSIESGKPLILPAVDATKLAKEVILRKSQE